MGSLEAVFLADSACYSISEWWLEPYTKGPGAHVHDEDDVFYVIEGTMSFRIGRRWVDAEVGTLVVAPGGTKHDFENRSAKRAGVLNLSIPGPFEPHMPGIAAWFRARAPEDARTANAPPARRARSR